ncbi:MAG TPA: cation-efflux pump [Actinomycetota bacterium]|nr:cation-efflux pump [Actinomycetota bacterium]
MDRTAPAAQRTAATAVTITVALAGAKIVLWLVTGSLAVLSQTLDSILDIVALGLLYVGIRIAAKPADTTHHYGHTKAEHLVVFVQTIFLGLIVVWVGAGAVMRLGETSSDVHAPWYAFALMGVSAVIDAIRVRTLMSAARAQRSDALLAGALNLFSDVGTAVVTIVSLAFVRAGIESADAVGALIVAVVVAVAAFRLGKVAVDALMDRAPEAPVAAIADAAGRAAGVAETRRVRVRGAGDRIFADVTVAAGRTTSLERAHDIAEEVETEITRDFPGADVVVHVEPTSETTGLVERVQAAASRTPGVHEVHNVLVHAFDEGGRSKLHVTLHAKVRANVPLEEAHRVSDAIEAAVSDELGPDVRVDSHIEPMRSTSPAVDVTSSRPELVESIRAIALEEPDVLNCHEVLLSSSGHEVSVTAHVGGRADLPLERIHDASERIEKSIRSAHPDIGAVTIHFEPV